MEQMHRISCEKEHSSLQAGQFPQILMRLTIQKLSEPCLSEFFWRYHHIGRLD